MNITKKVLQFIIRKCLLLAEEPLAEPDWYKDAVNIYQRLSHGTIAYKDAKNIVQTSYILDRNAKEIFFKLDLPRAINVSKRIQQNKDFSC